MLPMLAGFMSTVLFVSSYLPMLLKAYRTKDLGSYSAMSLVLTNIANLSYSFYVFSLPAGPIWVLHCFYLASSLVMVVWYLRFRRRSRPVARWGARVGWSHAKRSGHAPGGESRSAHLQPESRALS